MASFKGHKLVKITLDKKSIKQREIEYVLDITEFKLYEAVVNKESLEVYKYKLVGEILLNEDNKVRKSNKLTVITYKKIDNDILKKVEKLINSELVRKGF